MRICELRGKTRSEGDKMLIITVQVNAPAGQAIGIKEDLAMHLEQFGDSRVVSVEEVPERQVSIFGGSNED